jgi:protein-S-isoprenylcysteine O-methyltransferase Ste14
MFFSREFRHWYFSRRGLLLLPPCSVLLLCFWNTVDRPEFLWPIGFTLLALGGVPRLWAACYIGRSSWTRRERADALVTGGPYGLCRNPLYVGNILIAMGFGVLSGLVWYLPILFLILAGHYSLVVRCEESFLEERFRDEYRAYRERVPRWIPKALRPQQGSAPKCTLREVLSREWPRILTLGAGAALVWGRMLVERHLLH